MRQEDALDMQLDAARLPRDPDAPVGDATDANTTLFFGQGKTMEAGDMTVTVPHGDAGPPAHLAPREVPPLESDDEDDEF